MIVAYILVVAYYSGGMMNPIPPMADMASCERAKAAFTGDFQTRAKCVQVLIPAPSDKAYFYMPNKIETK